MEKQKRLFRSGHILEWINLVSIKQLKKDIDDIEKLGATHIDISCGISYEAPFVTIEAVCERYETEEEIESRIKAAERLKDLAKEQDLKRFEEIKNKYNL